MGKRARRRQRAAMNEMNQMVQDQQQMFSERQKEQQAILDRQRQSFQDFQFENPFADIKNPYADLKTEFENLYEGMENPYEDLTVNMRAAEFQAEQGAQQRANILSALRGAAGGSGIAGLAQSLANQGAVQAQQISANIGQQEAANQRLAAQGAAQIQQMERAGAEQARRLGISREQLVAQGAGQAEQLRMQGAAAVQQAEFGRESTLLGVEYGLLAGANQAEQQAMANQMSAMGMEVDMHGSQAANNPFSQILSAGAQVAAAKITAGACIAKGIHIDTVDGSMAIEDINIGDIVIGYNGNPTEVLQIHTYKEDPKHVFYDIKINYNGETRVVNVGGWHRIMGIPAPDIKENVLEKNEYTGVKISYDLLTEDAGYRMNGVPVNSMIEEMAELTVKLKNN